MDPAGMGKCSLHYRRFYFDNMVKGGKNDKKCNKELKKGLAKWNQGLIDKCFYISDCWNQKRDVEPGEFASRFILFYASRPRGLFPHGEIDDPQYFRRKAHQRTNSILSVMNARPCASSSTLARTPTHLNASPTCGAAVMLAKGLRSWVRRLRLLTLHHLSSVLLHWLLVSVHCFLSAASAYFACTNRYVKVIYLPATTQCIFDGTCKPGDIMGLPKNIKVSARGSS